ncbi:NAD(P)-dependent oxidoreductase [Parasphaerochaeta coccoides]|uniref:Glutamate synthase (NADPH) n=1 Tax=Parasphaerochaeta coccoides (strain ATCC BAA-1237 / DSM 17374 / SPN1) TaxID=760011 RepID=F4GHR3_PARC1|nr:NAD(P)-dependent oxidoreductase [Parasphaerochaeta coccoides]AEC01601.1 Glutamate synthase (NADPH) [Parasphaerochaeta coccoides DSM 17374]
MSLHVIDEANRCLQCKKPLCRQGCPVNTPIPEAISLLKENKIQAAGKLLFGNNPLSIVCAHVCPQENQCEGHCVLGKKGSPILFSEIERYISGYYIDLFDPLPSRKDKGKVAIIGSGPAGITIAFDLSSRGYDVTIFERYDKIGGVLRYGIPDFRLPKPILDRMSDMLRASGVTIRPNTSIGTNLTIEDLFRDAYRAVFMGTGVWKPRKLNLPGETLGHVHFAIDYLRNPEVYRLGNTVAVIGAGDVAMDAARTALRHGSQNVYVLYAKREQDVSAREVEVSYAKIDGATFLFNTEPIAFVDGGVIVADTIVEDQEGGRPIVRTVEGSQRLFSADSVIVSIGQGPRSVIVDSTPGIEVSDKGLVNVDDSGRTTHDGIFASGDVVTGARTVVEAVKVSRRVADAMDDYISTHFPTDAHLREKAPGEKKSEKHFTS